MGSSLSKLRDLTIIVGIYLYFIAWVYVHYYYQQFGISTSSLKIDYSTYLMYSYNVLISERFLSWFIALIVVALLRMLLLWLIATRKERSSFFKKADNILKGNAFLNIGNNPDKSYSLFFLICILLVIFPLLFRISRLTAIENYREDRRQIQHLKTIRFIFREDADLLSPATALDSTLSREDIFYQDIALIKNDTTQILKLLGESDAYYIVLHQQAYNPVLNALPSGYIYYINKKDILLTKIILRSL